MASEILKIGRTLDFGSQGRMTEITINAAGMARAMFVNADSIEQQHITRGDKVEINSDGTVKLSSKAENLFGCLHHISITGSNLERTREFYVDKLGFKVVEEKFRDGQNDYRMDLKQGNVRLEIFIKTENPELSGNQNTNSLRHICFHVASVDDTVHALNNMGIETEPVRNDTFTGEKLTFFKDPDGLPIEIHE